MLLLNMNTKIIHGKSNVSFTFDLGWTWKTKVNSLSFRRSYLEYVIGMVEGWSVKRFAFRWEIHNISSIRLKSTYFSFWLKLQIQVLVYTIVYFNYTISLRGIVSLRKYKLPRTFCAVWSHTLHKEVKDNLKNSRCFVLFHELGFTLVFKSRYWKISLTFLCSVHFLLLLGYNWYANI